jgi:GST-like protein
MAGGIGNVDVNAPDSVPFATERYAKETRRLYGVLDRRLDDREFIAGEFSIADIACYPWIVAQRQNIDEFTRLKRWLDTLAARPATRRAYAGVDDAPAKYRRPVAGAAPESALRATSSAA